MITALPATLEVGLSLKHTATHSEHVESSSKPATGGLQCILWSLRFASRPGHWLLGGRSGAERERGGAQGHQKGSFFTDVSKCAWAARSRRPRVSGFKIAGSHGEGALRIR